ncbi:MAG: ABC-F family ATP-binding cassette domain-containing protein [Chitinispirillales bacterium]|jgi:ATP-binding cassette subfamily F protein 3|nr:ABC-F family ATP-binding cassette domain-containing protein [Chitinispirillales bacterium]
MISFTNISKQYGDKILFDGVSFSINEKRSTALIGPNGSGKTTLLKMMQNIEQPDKGAVVIPGNLSIGWLPQEVETLSDATPLDTVLEPYHHLLNYETALEDAADGIVRGDAGALSRIHELEEEMRVHDGFSLQSRAEMILAGLGVPQDFWCRPLDNLSGGYRMRAVLGRLLLQNPDFMLLDEPTNHLDMDSLIWLERFLQAYKGGMLIVSHDRDFLNRMCTHTADVKVRSVRVFSGNYDRYIIAKREEETSAEARIKNLEVKIASAERFVERFKAKATKATQAQSRVKMIENLKAELPELEAEQKTIRFAFTCSCESGAVPLRLKNCTAGYGDNIVLNDVDLEIRRGDKVAIIGPNGAGKSTLLKLLAGMIKPMSGEMVLGHNTELRYFGQHQLEQLHGEDTLYDTVARTASSTDRNYIRNALGAFLFSGTSIEKQVKVLSGGEKSRLALAAILASPGNVLLLDEPTNHLDISSIEMLSESMADYGGTILFVSHDEYFISRLATRIIEVRTGFFRNFPGNLSDYRYYIDTLFKDAETKSSANLKNKKLIDDDVRETKENRIKEREERKKRDREVSKLEQEIIKREFEISDHELILNDPNNALNHELLHSASETIARLKKELDDFMEKWLMVSG